MKPDRDLLDKWRLLGTIACDRALSRANFTVAMVLLETLADDGFSQLSIPELTALTGRSRATVQRSLGRLVAARYFEATASCGRGNRKTYRLNFKACAAAPVTNA